MGIEVNRALEKLDRYLAEKNFPAAERHLDFWLAEAEQTGDLRGALTIVNEQIGLYRKQEKREEALTAVDRAFAQCSALELDGTVGYATTLVNAATAYRAFDLPERALPLYEKARTVYEAQLSPEDGRLGGLYNNMALTVMELGDYSRAEMLFRRALEVMSAAPERAGEMAVTYCNLADLNYARLGTDGAEAAVEECLQRAMELLDATGPERNADYAYICEKCAPCFGYYGYFLQERELSERARAIYERA